VLKRLAIPMLAAAMLGVAAAPALAANTVALDGGVMKVTFTTAALLGPDESGGNVVVSVSFGGTAFDSAQAPCTLSGGGMTASCPAAQTNSVSITTGDAGDLLLVGSSLTKPLVWNAGGGDDTANVLLGSGSGSSAREELHGGPGSDFLVGGAGADLIDGGAGADRLVFRQGDEVFGGPDRKSTRLNSRSPS